MTSTGVRPSVSVPGARRILAGRASSPVGTAADVSHSLSVHMLAQRASVPRDTLRTKEKPRKQLIYLVPGVLGGSRGVVTLCRVPI